MTLFKFLGENRSYTYGKEIDGEDVINSNSSDDWSTTQNNSTKLKQANEYGIAGFILCFILPLQKMVLANIAFPSQEILSFFIIFFFTIIALSLSIIGTAKNSREYQKGLAIWGLIINSFFVLQLLLEFFI